MKKSLRALSVPAIYAVIGLAVLFLMEFASARSPLGGYALINGKPLAAAVTVAVLAAACVLADSIIGRRYVGAALVGLIAIVFGFISSEKQRYLAEPLFPWDFLFAHQIIDLLPELAAARPKLSIALAAAGFTGVAGLLWLFIVAARRMAPIPILSRVAGILIGLAVIIPFGYGGQVKGQILFRDYLGLTNRIQFQNENYKKNGFLVAFLLNFDRAFVPRPSDYSEDKVASVIRTIDGAGPNQPIETVSPTQKPNVVLIMSEAFWDPTQFPKITFDKDPMPFVRSSSAGEIFSPAFGGGTCNVEFEALTGFSNSFLPEGSFPYQQYILRNTPALPWYFRSIGYRAIALHPYQKWFWNRDKVYPRLGFEKFIGISDLKGPRKLGPYVSDDQLTDLILENLSASEPTFLFAVTMQNHTPFAPKRYGETQITPGGDISAEDAEVLSSYTQGVVFSDQALKRLSENLKSLDRPTVLIFFGDHAPGLGPSLAIYKTSGLLEGARSGAEQLMKIRRTPLAVWSNTGRAPSPVGTISPAFIPHLIMDEVGLDHPFYKRFLGSLMKDVRVMDRNAYMTSDMQLSGNRPERLAPLLDRYYSLQYDQMFGSQYARKSLFCEMPGADCQRQTSAVAMPTP